MWSNRQQPELLSGRTRNVLLGISDLDLNHRRRLHVSGTGAEGAEKRRDVDGVEGWIVRGVPVASRLGGSGERRKLPSGEFFYFWHL